MPFVGTFAGDSARGKGMFNAKIAYTAPTINTSGVITSMTTGATSGGNVSASGGSGVYSYSVYSGSLPYNLTLNTSTGYITGTLQAGGTFNVVFRVTDTVSGLTANSSTITITTTYNSIYAFTPYSSYTTPYSDLEKFNLSLSTYTNNSFFSNSGGTIAQQMATDSYGRIFAPLPNNAGIAIWSNGSYSLISLGAGFNIYSNACLGPDGNMYVGGAYASSSSGLILKYDSALTQTAYIDSGSASVYGICSDGSSKLYFNYNNGIRYFDTSSHSFSTIFTGIISYTITSQIAYPGDGNVYTTMTSNIGSRTSRRNVWQMAKVTTGGSYTAYTIHDSGGGSNDAAGSLCSTVISGTPYVYLGGYSAVDGVSAMASFNTSTNAITVYIPTLLTGNGYNQPVTSIFAHTNGSIYGSANIPSAATSFILRLTSGTFSSGSAASGESIYSITAGP